MLTATRSIALLANVAVLPPKGLNTTTYLDINSFARDTAWAHGFMHTYALWLGAVLLATLFVLAYATIWWRRDDHAAALMGLGGIGTLAALGLNQIVGHAAKELRPYDTLHHVLVLVPRAHDYAFPSDHAVIAGALITSILLVSRRASASNRHNEFVPAMVALGLLSVVFGLFLCFARVYVGAHYPGDVVAGLLLGAFVVTVVSLARPIAYRLTDIIEPMPLGILIRRAPATLARKVTSN
ncbi:MAG: phosphatase PAP2 family protein [Acidimicrobiales bacterium]